ncbi:cobalamin adenosyltransferase [Desulfoluna butyratoxydans]|uniref:Cobalamin adenosyltransferase n=1 Tax=Desulfoluna butyratoxydans TaxID=231438 RepID=A0A4U8YUM7_9BACT|nr:cobalamin adenosyltransferase [Desulfoluna butyratoxydans]VFQ45053.1 cobalamin adenosyltransferase [Desulfoluna butyratoxydans]
MKVISETYLREIFRKDVPETFKLEEGQILTPSASQLLGEKGVKVVRGEEASCASQPEAAPEKTEAEGKTGPTYVSAVDGSFYDTKPEHMTQLTGNRLVPKDHPRIVFRGRLDTCQGEILLLQAKAHDAGKKALVADLSEILEWTRDIMRRDVLDTPMPDKPILGLTDGELRAHSHNPKKYYGVGHLLPTYDMGEMILKLNRLRALVRELEVSAVSVLKESFQLGTPDMVQALNRMSSAIYIMMLKDKGGMYT